MIYLFVLLTTYILGLHLLKRLPKFFILFLRIEKLFCYYLKTCATFVLLHALSYFVLDFFYIDCITSNYITWHFTKNIIIVFAMKTFLAKINCFSFVYILPHPRQKIQFCVFVFLTFLRWFNFILLLLFFKFLLQDLYLET